MHLAFLQAGIGIMIILTTALLPEPGGIADRQVEAVARSRNLTLLQLASGDEMELIELLQMIDTVRDSVGKLVVTNKARLGNNLIVALVVKYQVHAGPNREEVIT